MAERVEMKHPKMKGAARPLKVDVPKWEAQGWVATEKPRKRAKDQAEPLASPVESADSANTTANGKGK